MNMTMPVQTSEKHLLDRAEALVPSLRERADQIAQARAIPNNVMQDLDKAGLLYLLKPKRHGGPELDYDSFLRVGRVLSEGDASVAWVYFVMSLPDILINLFPVSVQDAYWTSSQPSGVASAIPVGPDSIAKLAPGGYSLSGKWGYCSGVDHAGWIMIGTSVGMVGDPPRPDRRFLLLPLSDVTVEDDWNVMGMRGTGSKSVTINNVFVPEERAVSFEQIGRGLPDHSNPMFRQSLWILSSFCIAASATGIARSMYKMNIESFLTRAGKFDPLFESRKPVTQVELAETSALIDCSDMIFRRALDETFDKLRAGVALSVEDRVRNRRDQTFSALLARQASEKLFAMAGSRAVAESHPLQKCLRDIETVTTHPGANWGTPALQFGAVAIGEAPIEFMI